VKIEKHKVVSIHYTLKGDDGEVIDTSRREGGQPLNYIQGIGNLIPGLEAVLEGKESGNSLEVSIEPTEAYGEFQESLVKQVPRSAFEVAKDLQVGMRFQSQGEQGNMQLFTISKVEEDNITINGNHDLAGQRLHFDVEVMEVRDASQEELDHGHGPGGH
jgi:FKBP-type peptidyl-prolyl cis-trans isomerase SlyD